MLVPRHRLGPLACSVAYTSLQFPGQTTRLMLLSENMHFVTQSALQDPPEEKCNLLEEQETGPSQHATYF